MRRHRAFVLILFCVLSAARVVPASAGPILESGKKLYSWHDEELIVRDYFSDRRGGFFVDIGCAHYQDGSNTYYLEKHLGWSGIAVDALAEFALGYIENRPGTRFFNFIVSDRSGRVERFYRQQDEALSATSSTSRMFIKGASFMARVKPRFQVLYLPTVTLTDLLAANGVSRIDFLNLDIELGELKALEGFDIERFRPALVCVEALTGAQRKKLLAYFRKHGYELIEAYRPRDGANLYFRPAK